MCESETHDAVGSGFASRGTEAMGASGGVGSEITCSTPSSHKVRGPLKWPAPRRILGRQVEGPGSRAAFSVQVFGHSVMRQPKGRYALLRERKRPHDPRGGSGSDWPRKPWGATGRPDQKLPAARLLLRLSDRSPREGPLEFAEAQARSPRPTKWSYLPVGQLPPYLRTTELGAQV